MAHILENAKPDKTFTMGEMIEEKINELAVRMGDARGFFDTDDAELIDAWRNELFAIRNAAHKMFVKSDKTPERPTPSKTEPGQ